MRRVSLFQGILLFLLVGCAGPAQIARPAAFPLHATDHPFFDLHWRLEQSDGEVRAVGRVEAGRVDGIAEVLLELQGLDVEGHIVSRGLGHTYGGRLLRWQVRPFLVRLHSTGQEARFELRVWSYEWEGTRDRGARDGGLWGWRPGSSFIRATLPKPATFAGAPG